MLARLVNTLLFAKQGFDGFGQVADVDALLFGDIRCGHHVAVPDCYRSNETIGRVGTADGKGGDVTVWTVDFVEGPAIVGVELVGVAGDGGVSWDFAAAPLADAFAKVIGVWWGEDTGVLAPVTADFGVFERVEEGVAGVCAEEVLVEVAHAVDEFTENDGYGKEVPVGVACGAGSADEFGASFGGGFRASVPGLSVAVQASPTNFLGHYLIVCYGTA